MGPGHRARWPSPRPAATQSGPRWRWRRTGRAAAARHRQRRYHGAAVGPGHRAAGATLTATTARTSVASGPGRTGGCCWPPAAGTTRCGCGTRHRPARWAAARPPHRPGGGEWRSAPGRAGGCCCHRQRDRTVRLWDPANREAGQPRRPHGGSCGRGVRPGRAALLASGSEDRTVRLWDPASRTAGEPLFRPHRPGGGGVRRRAGRAAAARLRQQRQDGAAVGPGHRPPRSPAAHGHTGRPARWRSAPGRAARCCLPPPAGDGTVRLWDPAPRPAAASRWPATPAGCTSVAFGVGRTGGCCSPPPARTERCGCGTRAPGPGWAEPLDRPHRLGVLGGVPRRAGREAAARLRWRGQDGTAVGPGHRRPAWPAARPAAPAGEVGGVRRRAGRAPVLASAGYDGKVWLWDVGTGRWAQRSWQRPRLRLERGLQTAWERARLARGAAHRPHHVGDLGGVRRRAGRACCCWPPPAMTRRCGCGTWPAGPATSRFTRRSSIRSVAIANRALAIGDDEGVSVIELDSVPGTRPAG